MAPKKSNPSGKVAPQPARSADQALEVLIQQAKRQLEQMIDLNPESMVLVNAVGCVLRTNRAFVDLLGAEGYEGVLGETLSTLFPTEDPQFFKDLLLAHGRTETREVTIVQAGSLQRVVRFTAVPGAQDSGTLIVIARDTTLEKSEAELIQKSYKVEAVRALMGALMHHLNQPLTVLMVRANLMQQAIEQRRLDPEELKATCKDIMDLTMRMANVLKRVEESNDYQTQTYIKGMNILKIDED
ncbi:MAG: PAS domain-containing protein [Verrucomicrobia bacterium]|nr:PAS domain-containing protein [Verrucomicrobiota bacterium]